MDAGFSDFWRLDGPAQLRFVVQPLIALLLGARDGRLDAHISAMPYFERILRDDGRGGALRHGLRAIAVPSAIAICLDAIVQYLVLGSVGVAAALIVGVLLVALPYVVARGLTNRVVRHRRGAVAGRSVR